MMNVKVIAIALILIVALPVGAGYCLNFEDVTKTVWQAGESNNITDNLIQGEAVYYTDSSSYLNNAFIFSGNTISSPSYNEVGTTKTSLPLSDALYQNTLTLTTSYQTVYSTTMLIAEIEVNIEDPDEGEPANTATMRLTQFTGSTIEITISADTTITQCYGTVNCNGTLYYNVFKIEMKASINAGASLDWAYQPIGVTPTAYADPNYGWQVSSNKYWCCNNTDIDSVLLTIEINKNKSFSIQPRTAEGTNGTLLLVTRNASGMITANTHDVGNYDYIRIIVSTKSFQIYGVAGSTWPSMNGLDAPINTVTVSNSLNQNFEYIKVSVGASYRVDNVRSVAGSYPAIVDSTFTCGDILPGTESYKLSLSKIDLAGTSITFAGTTYNVTNGRLIVGTKSFNVDNGLTFESTKQSSTVWKNTINGAAVSNTVNTATVTLNGTWSLLADVNGLSQATVTTNEWVPGHYGLDVTDACIVGLIGCLAVFVALGLYGQRSGAKVWPLMLVCGSAALIFLCII